ncbi:MAG: DNA repair protein RadC [Candidatus Methanoperedens sp.]|nr:DNA repair protein RadC [Candidatus Methanoperedens sp.]
MIKVKSLEVREIEYTYDKRPKINSMDDVVRIVKPMIADPNKEFFMALYLNTKNGVLKQEVISIGSLNANIVHPREIFKAACMISASSIIVAHNHPSGDPTPSREDIEITKKLHEAGKMMGIELLDHVIIGYDRYYGFKESGQL